MWNGVRGIGQAGGETGGVWNSVRQYFSFQWHITDECDQRCKHCYIFSGEGCKELKSMTWEQMQQVVANCEDFCKTYNRVPYFYITGGDPILHPHFWKLMVLLKSKEIPFTIMGNPFHLNDEVCRMLKTCGREKYQMSLDGMRQTHDWFRKPGSFELTLEQVACLNRAGITSIIMSTVSKTNMDEIPEIIDEVVKAKVKVFAFSRYVPTGGEVDAGMTPKEYRELLEDGRVQILCYTKYKEMIRLSGKAYAVADEEQIKWRERIFEEQPYLSNVYPGDTRDIGIIFCIDQGEVEYFNLGVKPIFRETYLLGNGIIKEKGYFITDSCIGCGRCAKNCPQNCIEKGAPYVISQRHCLHCGSCYEKCPVKAVKRFVSAHA